MNQYTDRRYVFAAAIILVGLLFMIRLFHIQIIDKSYEQYALSNAQSVRVIYPARGLIYDRNGEIMVYNKAAYDIMVTPRLMEPFDTTLLCRILQISRESVRERLESARAYSSRVPSVFMKQLSYENAALLQEKMFQFPGFYVQTRTLREYASPIASHALGYVGEVGQDILDKDPYYQLGDYMGVSGIEKAYEEYLRGNKGKNVFLKDVHNQTIESYQAGRLDVTVEVGQNLTSTLDMELQEYGEKLMSPYVGSVVALEPSTGEVLALVSAPTYSPDLLVGRSLGVEFGKLAEDTLNPLFNRALMAQYPPGSTFKTLMGLIGLQEKVISTRTEHHCYYGFYVGNIHTGCHLHETPLNLIEAIQNSCNTYFINVLKSILQDVKFSSTAEAYENWRRHLLSMGFSAPLGIELTNELDGNVPNSGYFNQIYGENHWNYLTVRSLAIGQGELLVTPIQMANMTATIANRGYYITPHLVRKIEGEEHIDEALLEKHYTTIDSSNYGPIVDGMDLVVNGDKGSTARNARIEGITLCGKTGTAENPHGNDHSIFIAFAPKENPRIAIAVYVENQGFGTTYAAPIASLMIEKYLTREVKRTWYENWVMQLVQPVAPSRNTDTAVSDTVSINQRDDGTEE
ncbi:MAG: penicillin-binding transpeptidase domain-containing protein [Bacteroidales bacterium]|nr:penicillin-binding transpeptidase domain-containing protein [Bacteroidales bacterium]